MLRATHILLIECSSQHIHLRPVLEINKILFFAQTLCTFRLTWMGTLTFKTPKRKQWRWLQSGSQIFAVERRLHTDRSSVNIKFISCNFGHDFGVHGWSYCYLDRLLLPQAEKSNLIAKSFPIRSALTFCLYFSLIQKKKSLHFAECGNTWDRNKSHSRQFFK